MINLITDTVTKESDDSYTREIATQNVAYSFSIPAEAVKKRIEIAEATSDLIIRIKRGDI